MTLVKCLLVAALLMGGSPPIAIKVNPSVVFGGGSVRVTCTVPRNAANRELRIGIADYTESGRQLEGENAAITHQHLFSHIPCESEKAYCALIKNDGSLTVATATLEVSCSE